MEAMRHTEFRAWRVKRGMTQRQAATYLNLSIATIRAYEASPRRTTKRRKVPEYLPKYMNALLDSEMLRAAPAALRKQVVQAYREQQRQQRA
jgi:transcriptional regulator with XRE-family HTH domain